MTKRKVPLSGHFGSRWTVATCIRCYFGCYCQGLSMFPAYGVAMQMQSLADIRAHYMLDGVELVCGVRRGPGARHQTPGGAASNGSFSIAGMCSTTRWFQSDSHSSSPCGISIQPGEENSSCKRWRGLGNMDGGTPFGDQAPPQTMAPASTTGPTSMERKLKVSQVLDQGDDGEFYVESEDTSYRWPTSWGRRTELGTAERFGTKDQNPGHSPLNGFWVFVPYGQRALRTSKYRTFVLLPDGYTAKELPGPSNFVQWRACFRVLRSALLMLECVSLANIHLYEMHIEKLTRLYASAWHLVYSADDLARSAHANRTRSRILMDIKSGKKAPDGWDPMKPWDTVYKLLVSDERFWQEQVHGPALAWIAAGSKGPPKTPAENTPWPQ